MLVYEKKVEDERHLFGTMGNVPGDDDVQLTYKDENGSEVTPSLDYSFFDDGKGGIKMVDDEGVETELNVFIEDVNIIPGDFEAPEFNITITDDGHGTASASPAKAVVGTEITLSNTPSEGYEFKAYASDDVEIANSKFEMPAKNVAISVEFKQISYTITIADDGNGTASASAESAVAGTEITLSNTPAEGYQFVAYTSEDVEIADGKFTMPAKNVTVTATFEAIPATIYNVTVNANNAEYGTVSASPASGETGTTVSLVATPATGYVFSEWQVVSGGVTISDNSFEIGEADVEITAVFVAENQNEPEGN